MVHYSLEGLAPGSVLEGVEERQILHQGEVLMRLEDTQSRGAGSHVSTRTVRTPPTLEPGVYTLRVTVSVADQTASGESLFMVPEPGPP